MNKPPFHPVLCALLNSSIKWIEKTVDRKNRDKTIREIANDNIIELDQLNQSNPFNPALLIAAAYFFLYPKESGEKYSIATSAFTVLEGKNENLLRRLRNSLSHGNYTFRGKNIIEFTDSKKDGNDFIRFHIDFKQFGQFLNECLTTRST